MKKNKIFRGLLIFSYIAVGVTVFLATAVSNFPTQYIKENVFKMIEQDTKVKVSANKLDLKLIFPGLKLGDVNIQLPYTLGGYKLNVKEMELSPGILGLIMGNLAGSVSVKGFGGDIYASGSSSKDSLSLSIKAKTLNIEEIPPLLKMVPIDIGAKISVDAGIDLNPNKLSTLEGKGILELPELKIKNQNFFGLNVPELFVKASNINFTSEKGNVTITKGQIGKPGDDIEGTLSGKIKLADVMNSSTLDLTIKFKFSKKVDDNLSIVGSLLTGKNKEGFYTYKIAGTFDAPLPTPVTQ